MWNPFASKPAPPSPVAALRRSAVRIALAKAEMDGTPTAHQFPIQPPQLIPGVVPPNVTPAIAMDADCSGPSYDYARFMMAGMGTVQGFPGYPYLSMLATRAEFRAFAAAISTELTREWITLNSSDTAGESTKNKITELTKALDDFGVKSIIQKAAEHDCLFGRGEVFVDIDGQDRALPLILDARTIKKNSLKRIVNVEPIWTTPVAYNSIDPTAPDFYKPSKWWMLGQEVHASRLLTVITRELPDMLKPAFNFSGMSMSQLAEPYVDNWLRTRQSVADLISNFSIVSLATSMDQVLQGTGNAEIDGQAATDLFSRAKLFTLTRSNKGIFLTDKDREELSQLAVPLSGLHELQAQSQEQMCAVSTVPSVTLLGIAPSGFGNVAEGEMRSSYDKTAATQEAYYRAPLEVILKVMQLSMYGEIDPDITFSFNPLYQMTAKELSEVRAADATSACAYIDRGVLDPQEERERLARDPESGYQGIDIYRVIEQPAAPGNPADGEGDDDAEPQA